jgi:signal transduction histidine kinase
LTVASLPARRRAAHWLSGLLAGAAMATVVTGAVVLLDPHLPALTLLVLYLLPVLVVAVRWGAGPAAVVAVLSTLVFGYLFLPPHRTWWVGDARNVVAVGVFLVTAVVVGNLAARLRRAAQESGRLTEEQAALRRVATLVAQAVPSTTVFEAVTREVGTLCGADLARMERYDDDGGVVGVAAWSRVPDRLAVGTRFDLDGVSIARQVRRTGGPVRVDSFTGADGAIAVEARNLGIRSSVGCPIVVDGHLWGAIAASSTRETSFPAGTESQITRFTELVATAIANAQSRADVVRLLEEQAALRRVATRVAHSAPPPEVFTTVAEEIGRVLGSDTSVMVRLDPDGMCTVVAAIGDAVDGTSVGSRWTLDPPLAEAVRTGRPASRDDEDPAQGGLADALRQWGVRSSVAIPVVVGGRIWGALVVGTRDDRLPSETEQRVAAFIELVATALTNAEARTALRRMADEQAALRRVATLAARGAEQERIVAAVAEEVGAMTGADGTAVLRFETDGMATFIGGSGWSENRMRRLGERWLPAPSSVTAAVRRTSRPARADNADCAYPFAEEHSGLRWAVASPIVVAGRLWGTVMVASSGGPFAADTEQRMADFTEIVGIAIANAEGRAELTASRARVIAAGDATRRQLERDLHDGAQQRLVSVALELRHFQGSVPADLPEVGAGLGRLADELTDALDELRELSRGIHPAALSEGGLGPALRTLARRASVPVELDLRTPARFPERVEVTAYYVVTEAVTNTTKHAGATYIEVVIEERDGGLWLRVRDDGAGGADPQRGSGLTGLRDRVEAMGGSILVNSPLGAGTLIEVVLPSQR